jgi:hypothetical protein
MHACVERLLHVLHMVFMIECVLAAGWRLLANLQNTFMRLDS